MARKITTRTRTAGPGLFGKRARPRRASSGGWLGPLPGVKAVDFPRSRRPRGGWLTTDAPAFTLIGKGRKR